MVVVGYLSSRFWKGKGFVSVFCSIGSSIVFAFFWLGGNRTVVWVKVVFSCRWRSESVVLELEGRVFGGVGIGWVNSSWRRSFDFI